MDRGPISGHDSIVHCAFLIPTVYAKGKFYTPIPLQVIRPSTGSLPTTSLLMLWFTFPLLFPTLRYIINPLSDFPSQPQKEWRQQFMVLGVVLNFQSLITDAHAVSELEIAKA